MAACALSSLAHARNVYLNGVDISTLRNKKFIKAEVTIDEDGNVRIHAPLYDVKVVDAATVPEKTAPNDRGGPNAALSKRYYLVTQPSASGRAQYKFTVSVNGEEKKNIAADAGQVILEMSKWLHKGENEVVIRAVKDISGGRKSTSSVDVAKVLVGIGHEENKIVKIDKIEARVETNASQTRDLTRRFVIVAE